MCTQQPESWPMKGRKWRQAKKERSLLLKKKRFKQFLPAQQVYKFKESEKIEKYFKKKQKRPNPKRKKHQKKRQRPRWKRRRNGRMTQWPEPDRNAPGRKSRVG